MARTVLVADDSPVIQNKAKGILAGQGFDVITVSNGVAAIKKLPQVNPLVVLADVSMPGKDGYEVCDFVKNSPELRHVAVLLVVSDMEDYNKERAAQVRADGFINKRATITPFDAQELISTVSKLVAQSEASVVKTELMPALSNAPALATASETETEEPAVPAKSTVDFGALSGEVAFTEPGAETTPSIWPDPVPLAPPPTKSLEIPSAPFETPTLRMQRPLEAHKTDGTRPGAEPVLVDDPTPIAPPAAPLSPERTLKFRSPAEIAGPVLKDDSARALEAPEPAPPSSSVPEPTREPASSLDSFSLGDAASGQVRFSSEESRSALSSEAPPPAPVDVKMVHKIVNKVVTKTSPAAIPLQAIEEMVNNLVEEIVAELDAESPSAP